MRHARIAPFPSRKVSPGGIVVIAIVLGVVGLIWWPVFANARDGRSPDFYRLRSMSRAQEVYLQDHDMRLQRGDLWMDALYPYVKTTTTFVDS